MRAATKLRFIIAFACFVFVVSVFYPFLEAQYKGLQIPEAIIGPFTFWSFKGTFVHGWQFPLRIVKDEWWFTGYWLNWRLDGVFQKWTPPVLIFMLGAQILSVSFSVFSILRLKPYVLVLLTILNVSVILSMWLVSYTLDSKYVRSFHYGFYFSVFSLFLYLAAFFLSRRWLPKSQMENTTKF